MLGREICKARQPECWHCPIVKLCRYEHKVFNAKDVDKTGASAEPQA